MTTYESKPHSIEAFFIRDMKITPPQWFTRAYQEGDVQVVNNAQSQYIVIYNRDTNEMRKAYVGDWVCRTAKGSVFPLTAEEFDYAFKKSTTAAKL